MRTLLVLLLLAVTAAAQQTTTAPSPARPVDVNVARRITPQQVKERTDAGEKVILVDARSTFTGPMIAGAVVVPGDDLAKWAKETPKDAFVVTYCTCPAEHSAANHVVQLQKYGFTNAYALQGGLSAWEAAGLPTETPKKPVD